MAIKKQSKHLYISNPFLLSFNRFGTFFEKNLGWALAIIILPFLGFIFQLMLNIIGALLSTSPSAHASSLDQAESTGLAIGLIAIIVIVYVCFVLLGIVFQVFITGVLTYVSLQNEADKTAPLKDAIDATVKRFWRLFIAQLLATIKIIAWSFLFIIPGIVAAFRYALLSYVIMDEPPENQGVKSAHERVKVLVRHRKREVFGVATVAAIIPVVGPILQITGNAALYRELQTFHDQKLEKPPIHWLNYLGFILIALLVLLLIAVGLLAAVAVQSNMSITY